MPLSAFSRTSFSSRLLKSHSLSRRSLRRAAGLGLGFLSLLSVSAGQAATSAGTVNWDGTVADWFSNPSHWSNGSIPGATDNAVNSTTAAMTFNGNDTVNSFFSSGAFTLQSGTFSGNQANSLSTITVNSVFTMNGGGISNFTVNPGSDGSFVIGTSGGNFLDNTIINSSVDMATNPSAFLRLYDTNTFNSAITLASSGTLDLRDGNANMVLGTAGNLVGAGTVSQDFGGGTLTNNGTINANSAGNTLNIVNTTLNSAAGSVLEASGGGILSLNNNITSAASILASGGTINISGTFTGTGGTITASNGGAVNILGTTLLGAINTDANTALILNNSGANNLNGTTVNGNLDLATQTNAFLRAFNADTVNGVITLGPTGILDLRDSNTNLTLGSGSLVGSGTVNEDFGGSTLTNNGTVNANSAGNTLSQINSNFVNNGTAEATNGGILSLNNNVTNNGLLAASSGGILDISGTLTGNTGSSINGTGGTVNINGVNLVGTINETAGTTLVLNSSGANNLNGTTVNGNLDLATNNAAFLRFFNLDTVNGVITMGPTGILDLRDGSANLTLGSNGSLVGAGTVTQDFGGGTLTNNGTVNADTSGQTLSQINSNFVNNGTAEATNGGTLALSNNATNNGTLNAAGTGSLVTLAGTFTGGGSNLITASGGGQVQADGVNLLGTINTDANTALVLNSSGANNLNGTTVNGNLDLATDPSAFLRSFNTDTVNGAITLGPGGTLDLRDGNANLILGSNGSLVGSGTVTQDFGGGTLTNNGTVNANSAGNTLNIVNSNFVNTGTTEVQNGAALNVTSANTDSGNVLVKTGGTATFTQGVTQTAGLTQVDGTFNSPLTLTGGTLRGTGTINGNVDNSGGTVAAGDSPGTLTVNGTFTQAPGGTLNEQFTNAAASILSVSGLVTTDGTLDVNYIDTAAYTGTGPFTFLDYGSLATTGTNALGLTQYFANEVALTNDTGTILGHNGFTYELINNTGLDALQLQVLTPGTPQAVPEASTTISLGLLLSLGGAGLWRMKRRTVTAD